MKRALLTLNAGMVVFDLALGTVAVAAPHTGLRLLGHRQPPDDAAWMFRRNGPVWLTFAAAHLVAAARGRSDDWWALAWLRGTEIATDALWTWSPGLAANPRGRLTLRLASVANLGMAAGFATLARRSER